VTSLTSPSENELNNADTELDSPEDQEGAQGDSIRRGAESPNMSEIESQPSSPVELEQPSIGDVAHIVAAINSSDEEVASPSGEAAERSSFLASSTAQQHAPAPGGAHLQHTYSRETQSDFTGNLSSASASNLHHDGQVHSLRSFSNPAATPSPGAAIPSSRPGPPLEHVGEHESQSGSIVNTNTANPPHGSQESLTHRPVPHGPLQTGGRNSGTQEAATSHVSSSRASEWHEPLHDVPTHQELLHPIPNRQDRRPGAARFNLFGGRTLGEVSNSLSETGTLTGSTKTGIAGEALFTVGGLWRTASAGVEFSNLCKSASSPQQQKQLLFTGMELMRGVSSTVSGITGVIGDATGISGVRLTSNLTWALSEGINAVRQGHDAVLAGKALTPEQMVRLGQVVGSTLKFGGLVASMAGVAGNAPTIALVAGTAVNMGSGVMNLNNKGYDLVSTVKEYTDTMAGLLPNRRGRNDSDPTPDELNPNAHEMV
jgi:hypothetical protein